MTLQQQGDMWLRLAGETSSKDKELVQDAPLMKKCLANLPQDEQDYDFKHLLDKIDKIETEARWADFHSRQVDERKQKEFETPNCLKKLCPSHPNCRIVFDQNQMAFEAYYPAGKPTRSVGMGWAGARTSKRTPLTCLMYCVDYMWDNHIAKNRVSRLASFLFE